MDNKKKRLSAPRPPRHSAEVREHLANERTLLSWVRTGVGLISVGFVVERAGAIVAGTPGGNASAIASERFGIALAILGCVTLVVGTIQFFRNRRKIIAGVVAPTSVPYLIVVAGSLALAVAFIIYVLR